MKSKHTLQREEDSLNKILDACAERFGFKPFQLKALNRKKDIVYARSVSMYVMRSKGFTTIRIADFFNMNHATVIHAENKIWSEMQIYSSVDKDVRRLTFQVRIRKTYHGNTNKYPDFCLPCIANQKLFTTFTK